MKKEGTSYSRRQFMKTGAVGVAAVCVGRWHARAESGDGPESPDRFHGFQMGIQSYSLRHFGLTDAIEHIAGLGLRWAEFYPGHFEVTRDSGRIEAVKGQLAPHKIGLSVHGVHGFGGNEQDSRRLFEFADLAGIPLLSADPAPEAFPILHDLVQEFDIKIGIHNHGPGSRYDRISDSLEAVEGWDERIGFCPDTGHYMRSGEDPVEMVELMKDRLHGVHLKDHDAIHRESPPEVILGDGALDLDAFCRALRDVGFANPISLEYELNPEDPTDDIRRGLDNFAKAAEATA